MKIIILLVVVFCGTIGVGINLLTSNTDRLAVEDSSATEQTDQTVVTYRPIPSSTYRIEGNPVQYNKKFQIQRFIELAKQLKLTNSMNTDLDHPRIQLRLKAMLDLSKLPRNGLSKHEQIQIYPLKVCCCLWLADLLGTQKPGSIQSNKITQDENELSIASRLWLPNRI